MMLGSTAETTMELHLPAGDDNASLVHVVVHIQDTLQCVKRYNLTPVVVRADKIEIDGLISELLFDINTTNETNGLLEQLTNPDQNIQTQALISWSKILNIIDEEIIENAIKGRTVKRHETFISQAYDSSGSWDCQSLCISVGKHGTAECKYLLQSLFEQLEIELCH